MTRIVLYILVVAGVAQADYHLRHIPLRSTIQFRKKYPLDPINGYANVGNSGCYVGGRRGSDVNDIGRGRVFDVFNVEEVFNHAPLKPFDPGIKYEFLEGERLSPIFMICHADVNIDELRRELREFAEFSLSQQPVDSKYGFRDRGFEDYGPGTVFVLNRDFRIEKNKPGFNPGHLYYYGLTFNEDEGCWIESPAALTLLKKRQALILRAKPRIEKWGVSQKVTALVSDAESGARLSIVCVGSQTQYEFQTRVGVFEVIQTGF